MKRIFFQISLVLTSVVWITACQNSATSDGSDSTIEEVVSNETAEPTLLGKWRLVNFEDNGIAKLDDCDAATIWDFTENKVGAYQGKNLYQLEATVEDPACRLYGFTADWEEVDDQATEVYIDNVKVGKGTNRGGTFKIEELTTKTLILKGGTFTYYLER